MIPSMIGTILPAPGAEELLNLKLSRVVRWVYANYGDDPPDWPTLLEILELPPCQKCNAPIIPRPLLGTAPMWLNESTALCSACYAREGEK